MKTTKRRRAGSIVRLVPTTSLPLVDLGLGADVSIRFPVTGPVVDILNVRGVPAAWVSEMLAPVVAGVWSKSLATGRRTTRSPRQ